MTPGDGVVASLLGFNGQDTVYFSAWIDSHLETHVYSVTCPAVSAVLKGECAVEALVWSAPKRLTPLGSSVTLILSYESYYRYTIFPFNYDLIDIVTFSHNLSTWFRLCHLIVRC